MSGGGRYNAMVVNGQFQPRRVAYESITADATLTPNDSGKTIFVGPTGVDITIPATPEKGLNYKFIMAEDNVTTACTITADGSGEFFAGSVSTAADGAATAIFDGSTTDVISFATTADQGDMVEVVSDGSTWFVQGQCFAAASITAATS